MQKVDGIGGVFFRAEDPKALAEWYERHLGIDPVAEVPWTTAAGHTVFAPFAKDTSYFGRDSQQWMINFRVADLAAMIAQLEAAGIAVQTNPAWDADGAYGKFARIHDPEGNPIELWEPPKA
ncbi:VOC family protein [Cognatishimia sp. SS12]|uniref:VOC family protein n=1 Tax=Cognatishimia sp. SS12 TaxID=2979465 RepID=UPI0023308275|nr:VOC family protein [Cognatishimia sp. SS12]MDC0736970.1 VOC family protein [Cognatishimia sp. SS12]